ncbi:MAG: TGS domain-containing protein, partial [Aureliella sp.]
NDVGVNITHTLVLLNKIDCDGACERITLLDDFLNLPLDRLEVSGLSGTGLEELRRQVFERLRIVRVYTKHPSEKEPDLTRPFTIRRGQTLLEVAKLVHDDVASRLKSGRIWNAAMSGGISVQPDYQPLDGDIVELLT